MSKVTIWGKQITLPTLSNGVVIMDLDGTLACGKHRLHKLPRKDLHLTESWREFNLLAGGDAPIKQTITVNNALYRAGLMVIILTGRTDEAEELTREWLHRHGVQYDYLLMRRASDNRKDTVMKEEALRAIGLDRIVCAYDDSPSVIAHMRSLGIQVYQVCDYGDNAHHRQDLASNGVNE